MENKQPLAVLFAVDKDDECDCNPILVAIGNRVDVEARKTELEAVLEDFNKALKEIYSNTQIEKASSMGINSASEYMEYRTKVKKKIDKELKDLMKDKPPYYNHTLIMLSQ